MADGPKTTIPSPREIEISQLLSTGLTHKEVAANLDISEKTVAAHIYNLHKKIGAKTAAHNVTLMAGLGYLAIPNVAPLNAHLKMLAAEALQNSSDELIDMVVHALQAKFPAAA